MIERTTHLRRLRNLLEQFPVVGLIGARQVGKTTLAKAVVNGFDGEATHFDLEDPRHRLFFDEIFRLACRYVGQCPGSQLLARESRRALGVDVDPQDVPLLA